MDPIIFLDVANELTKLKMFPYFDIAHFVVTCLYLREDLSTGKPLCSIVAKSINAFFCSL